MKIIYDLKNIFYLIICLLKLSTLKNVKYFFVFKLNKETFLTFCFEILYVFIDHRVILIVYQ